MTPGPLRALKFHSAYQPLAVPPSLLQSLQLFIVSPTSNSDPQCLPTSYSAAQQPLETSSPYKAHKSAEYPNPQLPHVQFDLLWLLTGLFGHGTGSTIGAGNATRLSSWSTQVIGPLEVAQVEVRCRISEYWWMGLRFEESRV